MIRKSLQAITLIFLSGSLLFCQNQDNEDIELQVNKDIWIPFAKTFNSFDAKGFIALHTDDVIRISREGKSIRVGQEYGQSQIESAKRNLERKRTRSIFFSFTERFYNSDFGYESGYYKVIYNSDTEPSTSYGYFNVVLKNIKGTWKIFLDSDTSYKNSLTENDFITGEILSN